MGMMERPQYTVVGGYSDGGVETYGSGDARRGVRDEAERGAWQPKRVLEATQRNGSTGEYGERGEDEPSFTVTPNADRWKFRNGNQANAAVRDQGEPAPTIHFGKACNQVEWVNEHGEPEEIAECGCYIGWVDADGFCACCHAHLSDPDGLYALQGDGTHQFDRCPANRPDWPKERPSTAVMGDPRIAPPGYRGGKADYERGKKPDSMFTPAESRNWGGDGPQPDECPATTVAGDPRLSSRTHHNHGEQTAHAIRVSLEEAAILQTFPPDYPFQGTKSQRFLQVGNAVPPLLAHAILSALLVPALIPSPSETSAG